MDKEQLRGKLRRLQQRTDLNEKGTQEQATKELLALTLASSSSSSSSSHDMLWQALQELLAPPKATLVTASVITQGKPFSYL